MEKVDITIIGVGVVGLAIAAKISDKNKSIVLLEKNKQFGQEISSRNSEVIHSGIYYPNKSLKAELCVKGNELLYDYCEKTGVKYARIGKIIVATNNDELNETRNLYENGIRNGVKGLELIDKNRIKSIEPEIVALGGLLSPSTGIFDTHGLMKSLFEQAKNNGVTAAFDSEVTQIEKISNSYKITIGRDDFRFTTNKIINCAGLYSDKIASIVGIDINKAGYKIRYCKGDYFRSYKKFNISRLIYPIPSMHVRSLGIHITKDLAGSIRLGPSAYYVDSVDYSIDEKLKVNFYTKVKPYFPNLKCEDLFPDTSGIRPKLQGPGENFRDFVIRDESDKGFPGFINLIGIESPGLTSCLAIAEYVNNEILCPK